MCNYAPVIQPLQSHHKPSNGCVSKSVAFCSPLFCLCGRRPRPRRSDRRSVLPKLLAEVARRRPAPLLGLICARPLGTMTKRPLCSSRGRSVHHYMEIAWFRFIPCSRGSSQTTASGIGGPGLDQKAKGSRAPPLAYPEPQRLPSQYEPPVTAHICPQGTSTDHH